MASCKDCIHQEACLDWCRGFEQETEKCVHFKDKSRFIELPCKVGDVVDVLFSHNEFIALWYDKPEDKESSYLLWKGMAWDLPDEYKEQRIIKFKGIIPERFSDADTINILVTPRIVPATLYEAEQKLKELENGKQ